MNATDAMAYEAKTAKKVFLYQNGSTHSRPKCMVVNDRQIRDFSTFLNRVTSGIRAPVAVRNIYTPSGGHRVHKLDELQSGGYYVAGGNENFKKIKYGSETLKSPSKRPKNEFFVPHRSQQILIATSRYKLPIEKPFVIHVFRNGDEKYRGARMLLPRKIMGSWEHVLELVTQKANLVTPAKRICTLDGRTIHSVSEIQDGGKYVAMEGSKPFQRVAYCATNEKRVALMRSLPKAAVRLRRKSEHQPGSDTTDGLLSDTNKTAPPLVSTRGPGTLRKRRSIRPMAGRKNKEGREKAIKDHREDSIFGGSPIHERGLDESIRSARMPSPPLKSILTTIRHGTDREREGQSDNVESSLEDSPPQKPGLAQIQETSAEATGTPAGASEGNEVTEVRESSATVTLKREMFHAARSSSKVVETSVEYVEEDQGGVFKAKEQRDEMEGAETILEGGETEVEKPVDQEEAQEVAEEEEADGSPEKQQPPLQLAKDIELESRPTQTTIDLSVNRTTSGANETNSAKHRAASTEAAKRAHSGSRTSSRQRHTGSRTSSRQQHTSSRPLSRHSQSHSQHSLLTTEPPQVPHTTEEPSQVEEEVTIEPPHTPQVVEEVTTAQEEGEAEEVKEEAAEETKEEIEEVTEEGGEDTEVPATSGSPAPSPPTSTPHEAKSLDTQSEPQNE